MKAFYGILKILFVLGIVQFMNPASNLLLPHFFNHVSINGIGLFNISNLLLTLMFKDVYISPLVAVLCLPFYIAFVRPFINSYELRIFGQIRVSITL